MQSLRTSSRTWPTITPILTRVWRLRIAHACHAPNAACNHFARPVGREIWEQSGGSIDAFVCGAGTGGTIAGVSTFLRARKPSVQVFLADPPGSSLHNKVPNVP